MICIYRLEVVELEFIMKGRSEQTLFGLLWCYGYHNTENGLKRK